MGDTVKKSRIVSDDEKDLEEALLEEFNIRLKNCMSQDDLQQKDDDEIENNDTYENLEISSTTTTTTECSSSSSKNIIQTQEHFLQHEIHYDEPRSLKQNGHIEQIYECIPPHEKTEIFDQNNYIPMNNIKLSVAEEYEPVGGVEEEIHHSNLYESVELKEKIINNTPIILNLPTTSLTDYSDEKSSPSEIEQKSAFSSVKNRMLLSSGDDASTLLFTQTVTSPMLTPSEENIDFLKGFETVSENDNNSSSISSVANKNNVEKIEDEQEENFYENTAFYKNTTPENMYENLLVENKDVQTNSKDDDDDAEEIYEELDMEKVVVEKEPVQTQREDTDESLEEFIKIEKEVSDEIEDVVVKENVTNNGENDLQNSSETYKELIYHHKTESNSNFYEKYTENLSSKKSDELVINNREKDTESVPAEIVKMLKNQFQNKASSSDELDNVKNRIKLNNSSTNNIINLKINQIKTKFEESTTEETEESTSEYHTETIVETNTPGEKSIKKKKVKKTRKEEKENCSVIDNNNEENYYKVSVKNLCRSFGDLTKLEKDYYNKKNSDRMRTKSLSGMVKNVFSGVSVKNLKEKFNTVGTNSKNCHHSMKSSFSKFDALQKKNVLHVRSSDSTKAQEKFSNGAQIELSTNCKTCGKQVFQMEQIKAEKAVWHQKCFRCIECSKQLTVDTYESNDGSLYCKPHFKALFAPKAVEDDVPSRPRRPQLIICENQPFELPPDVVRASDKPDLGLEEIQSLNVKERFQVFQQLQHSSVETISDFESKANANVKRSPSILSKLAKFQKHGMDVGVSNEALDGITVEESESEQEEEEEIDAEDEDPDLVRAKRVQKEKPFHFTGMSDVKKKWEQGDHAREERREETKQEIQNIRTRLFMGKQEKMKEAYQQAIMESESKTNLNKNLSTDKMIEICDTKSIKERFEKGEISNENKLVSSREKNDDEEVYESEISKNSRSLFLELDAAGAHKPPQLSPATPQKLDVKKAREAYLAKTSSSSSTEEIIKSTQQVEDVEVRTADIQERFKFFETYKEPEKEKKQFRITPPRDPSQVKTETPEKEIYRDPDVIRSEEYIDDSKIAKETHTASKMLNKFRQMEEDLTKEPDLQGPKPLKCFTPPLEPSRQETRSDEDESSEYEEEEEEDETDQIAAHGGGGGKLPEDLIEAQKAARAKQLRAKFERWEVNEIKKEQQNSVNIVEEFGEDQSQIESTRVIRARFEQMKEPNNSESPKSPRIKPNRFVEYSATFNENCQSCNEKVYPLEKLSIHGNIYHKKCFKCMECSCILRMDSYSYNQGLLYCTPHFKRLFISKGNYDTAFGLDQRKEKWQNNNLTMV